MHIVLRMLQKNYIEWGKVEKKACFESSLILEHDGHLPSVSLCYDKKTITGLATLGCAFNVKRSGLTAHLAVLQSCVGETVSNMPRAFLGDVCLY